MRDPKMSRLTRWLIEIRSDWPLMALGVTSLVAPFVVLGQGGAWHTALLSCPATLATPALAVEAMLGLARLGEWVEGGDAD